MQKDSCQTGLRCLLAGKCDLLECCQLGSSITTIPAAMAQNTINLIECFHKSCVHASSEPHSPSLQLGALAESWYTLEMHI